MRNKIIKDYALKEDEISYLDFMYGSAVWTKNPTMYIGVMRRDREVRECPECGCRISASDWEDYRMCESCHEKYRD